MVLVIRGVRVGQGSGWWCCLMSACGRSLNHHLVRDTPFILQVLENCCLVSNFWSSSFTLIFLHYPGIKVEAISFSSKSRYSLTPSGRSLPKCFVLISPKRANNNQEQIEKCCFFQCEKKRFRHFHLFILKDSERQMCYNIHGGRVSVTDR